MTQLVHREEGPRQRDDGGAQRDGDRARTTRSARSSCRPSARAYVWHNYGKSTIGARADVENVSIDRLQAFYRNYYQPDNAVLIITGKFDEAKTLAIVAREFGKIPRPTRKIQPHYTVDPEQQGERTRDAAPRGRHADRARRRTTCPRARSPDFAAIEIARDHHRRGADRVACTRRWWRPRRPRTSSASPSSWKRAGVVILGARAAHARPRSTRRARRWSQTIEGVAKDPITEAEVDRARTKYLKDFELHAERSRSAWASRCRPPSRRATGGSSSCSATACASAKAADVQRVASAYLAADNRTLGVFIPTANPKRPPKPRARGRGADGEGLQGRCRRWSQGEAFDATPDNIDKRTERAALANGMKRRALAQAHARRRRERAARAASGRREVALTGMRPLGPMTAAMLNRGAAA